MIFFSSLFFLLKFTCCGDVADPSWDGVRGAQGNNSCRGMECVVRGRVVGDSVSIADDAGLKRGASGLG